MSATLLREDWRPLAPFTVREACASDNEELIALAESCSMSGDIELRIDRRPDFFTLNELWILQKQLRAIGPERGAFGAAFVRLSRRRFRFSGGLR